MQSEPTPSARETFDDAFDRIFVLAYRAAFRILGSREDAEDVAMETLARASRRWERITGHVEPWITRVAANLALDAWRKRQGAAKAALGALPPPPATPLEAQRLDLVTALLRIPKRQRDTLVLRYFADLTEAQTAERMGVSVGTVKQQTFRAMDALRTDLSPTPDLP